MNESVTTVEALNEAHYYFLSLWPGSEQNTSLGALRIGNRLIPIPFRNHTTLVRAGHDESQRLIHATTAYFSDLGAIPAFQLDPQTDPPDFHRYLLTNGFHKRSEEAWMVLAEDRMASLKINPQVHVRRLKQTSAAHWVQAYLDCYVINFRAPAHAVVGFGKSFRGVLSHRAGVHYLASIDGMPAGSMSLFSQGGYGCVYNVGTFPQFRGRHVATSLFQILLNDSAELGNHTLFLQAVNGGPAQPLYNRIGFRTCFIRDWYLPAPPGGIWS